jgi:hypothetical protein
MEIENKEYIISNNGNFLHEILKLSDNGEAFYVDDIKNSSARTAIYHMNNTTIVANSIQVHIIGQLIDIEKTKNILRIGWESN